MKVLTDAVSKLNYQAGCATDDDEAFLARDQAKTLVGVAKQISEVAWQQGVKAPFAFYQGVSQTMGVEQPLPGRKPI
jgi:hypothetical protein